MKLSTIGHIVFLLVFATAVSAQQKFKMPRTADGRMLANEKFEMLEHFLERYQTQNSLAPYVESETKEELLISRSASGEIQVGVSGESESELHAVVNPLDGNNMIVGVMRFDVENLSNPIDISIYVTKDFGGSWEKSNFTVVKDDYIAVGGGDPMFAFNDQGELFFSYLLVDITSDFTELSWGMYMYKSTDGGNTWAQLGEPIDIANFTDLFGLTDLDYAVDKQWMASDLSSSSPYKGNVYIAYVSIDPISQTFRIIFKKKDAERSEFDEAGIIVSHTDQSLAQFTNIEVDNNGVIYLTYLADDDARRNVYSAYLAVSMDGGKSFGSPRKFIEFNFPDFGSTDMPIRGLSNARKYPCPQLGVDRSNTAYEGRLYFTFTAFGIELPASASTDIYLMYSDNLGNTWSTPQIVNIDEDEKLHQFYSSIVINENGDIGLAWYDRSSGPFTVEDRTNYMLGISEDGGDTFEQFQVNEASSNFLKYVSVNDGFGVGEYNEIVSSGEYMIPFWADGRTNDGNTAVYAHFFNKNTDAIYDKTILVSEEFGLSVPTPNPSSSSFAISFYKKTESTVALSLLDARGQLVRNIFSDLSFSGNYDVEVDVSDIPSGVYIISATSGTTVQTRKLVVKK